MAEFPDALIEQVARAIYAKYPDRQPWDGDSYAFGENPGGYRTELARSQARSVLDAVAPAIRAQALRDAADHFDAIGRHNPGGFYSEATAYADGQDSATEAAADWLRERADQITKEDR